MGSQQEKIVFKNVFTLYAVKWPDIYDLFKLYLTEIIIYSNAIPYQGLNNKNCIEIIIIASKTI